MHELSVARNIIEIVEQNVPKGELSCVREVMLKVGEFSGVVADSLKFSYEIITADTELQNSELKIEAVPFRLRCNSCGGITTNSCGLRECADCLKTDTEVLSGEELKITEIILEDKS
ncbi:MAG: hydrogenase maturation nickel metallochaperone HypA [Ignavibacteria bacterium]|nr:hydrogenase maturation nickel metallochaperone HypA [Ignavibacteria bacterium]MCC7158750.1 hydrogenase maturation nickel metallochaperone HypA [Ignavibacteria bacterium]